MEGLLFSGGGVLFTKIDSVTSPSGSIARKRFLKGFVKVSTRFSEGVEFTVFVASCLQAVVVLASGLMIVVDECRVPPPAVVANSCLQARLVRVRSLLCRPGT